jgi:hypothetical protein
MIRRQVGRKISGVSESKAISINQTEDLVQLVITTKSLIMRLMEGLELLLGHKKELVQTFQGHWIMPQLAIGIKINGLLALREILI